MAGPGSACLMFTIPDVRRRPLAMRCPEGSGPGDTVTAEVEWGSVALLLCTTAHPLHTMFTKRVGASISETRIRPNRSA